MIRSPEKSSTDLGVSEVIAKDTPRIGVVQWKLGDGIARQISNTLIDLGCDVVGFLYDAKLPKDLDIILAHGPLGSFVPLAKQLLFLPPSQRPVLVLWMTEHLPHPSLPEWLRRPISMVRSRVERLAFRKNTQGEWKLDSRLRWMTAKGHRFRYYGDLHWFRQQRIPFVLAVGSKWIANFLRARGFGPIVAYIGFHPNWQADLGLKRDVPVLWIGKLATDRRRRLLKRIRSELKARGVDVLVIDGVENPYVFGEERTILLNRTKIVLNILRSKWDNNGLRYYLTAPNRSLVVTEPTLDHTPFLPGVHLIEAPVEQITDTICYYLTHEDERQRIVEQAYQLVTTELTMKAGASQVLEKAVAVRRQATNSLP